MLVPPSLEEWLPQNHLARFIDELVDSELDLDRFYASQAKAKRQPPYDPRLMLHIMLYGYCTEVRSSRQLEKARSGPRISGPSDASANAISRPWSTSSCRPWNFAGRRAW